MKTGVKMQLEKAVWSGVFIFMWCSILCSASHMVSAFNIIAVYPTHRLSSLCHPLGCLKHLVVRAVLRVVIVDLIGLLVNLACSLLGRMEMEIVLSYDHPCLFCQFSSVACYLLSGIQFVQACCFQNS